MVDPVTVKTVPVLLAPPVAADWPPELVPAPPVTRLVAELEPWVMLVVTPRIWPPA